MAAAALVATGAMIATPMLAHQASPGVRSMETKLVDVGLENVLPNLFNDVLSLPAYYLQDGGGLASVADSFMYTGTWWVPSSTNIWGIDPGDPTHIALIDNFLPFETFTQGFTSVDPATGSDVYHPGLNYEFAGLLAAELPNTSSCDALSCAPMTPPDVITGSTQFDRDIGFFNALMGTATDADGHENGLFTQFFQVPLQNLIDGYKFMPPPADMPTTGTPTYDPGIINPAGPVNDDWANFLGWGSSGNPFENGTEMVNVPDYGPVDVNPWYGEDFHFNLFTPFQTYFESLMQEPATDGIGGTGIEALTFEGVTHNFENLAAGLIIDFDPYTEGSPACPALCDLPPGFQIPEIIASMSKMDPTNEVLSQWVSLYAKDPILVNEPNQDEINASVALLQTGIYNLDTQELTDVNKALDAINPALPALFAHAGYYTDPTYLAYTNGADTVLNPSTGELEPIINEATGQLNAVYGGYNPLATLDDFYTLFTNNETNFNELGNPALLLFLADPLTSPDPFNGGAVDGMSPFAALFGSAAADAAGGGSAATAATELPNLFGGFDMSGITADLSTILSSFGTTAGADALSAALTDLSAQFTAELANFAPSLASLF